MSPKRKLVLVVVRVLAFIDLCVMSWLAQQGIMDQSYLQPVIGGVAALYVPILFVIIWAPRKDGHRNRS